MSDAQHVLTILAVEDLQVHVEFYRAAFLWEPTVETPVYVEFQLKNGQRIGLYQREGFARNTGIVPAVIPPGHIGPTELYFYVEDLDASIDRINRAGATELSSLAPRVWGDEAAYYSDPSGNVLVLARPLR